jgi:hypothetical protein
MSIIQGHLAAGLPRSPRAFKDTSVSPSDPHCMPDNNDNNNDNDNENHVGTTSAILLFLRSYADDDIHHKSLGDDHPRLG